MPFPHCASASESERSKYPARYTSRKHAKKPSSTAVVRGTRSRRVPSANESRKRIASTSASDTVPAKFQCTFSNVTQKTLARNRKLVTRLTRAVPARSEERRVGKEG